MTKNRFNLVIRLTVFVFFFHKQFWNIVRKFSAELFQPSLFTLKILILNVMFYMVKTYFLKSS